MEDDYSKEIERRLEHIRSDDSLSEEERSLLLQLHDEIEGHNQRKSAANQISGTRHENYLSYGHRLVRDTDAMVEVLDPENGTDPVDEIGAWISDNYENGYTQDNYIAAFRAWGRFLAEDDVAGGEFPDRFGRLELGNVEDDQPAPDPTEVLFWADVVKIIAAACNPRTMAAIALLWASGLRPMSEFYELTFGDIDDRGDHMLIAISDSKTFERTIRIDVGLPYIRDWMQNKHPIHDTDKEPRADTPLWTQLGEPEKVGYQSIRRAINRSARSAGITKPHNPGHFRKSRASVLAMSRWVSQRDLEQHFGWVRGSRVVAHYIAVFGSKSRKHIAKADGAQVELDEERDPIVPVWCSECGRQTPRHLDTCYWCDADTTGDLPTDPAIVRDRFGDEDDENLLDLIADQEITADDLRTLKQLKPVLRRRDDLWERLPEYIAMTERMEDDG